MDLKKDVIQRCNELAEKYKYEGLHFLQGDISTYEGKEKEESGIAGEYPKSGKWIW